MGSVCAKYRLVNMRKNEVMLITVSRNERIFIQYGYKNPMVRTRNNYNFSSALNYECIFIVWHLLFYPYSSRIVRFTAVQLKGSSKYFRTYCILYILFFLFFVLWKIKITNASTNCDSNSSKRGKKTYFLP